MSGLISTLLIFVALMVIGYVIVNKNIVGPGFKKDASAVTINIFMCATIINSVLNDPPELTNAEVMYVLLLVFLQYLLFYAVGTLLCRFIAPSKAYNAVVMLLIAVNNSVFVGVPVAEQVLGSSAVLYITISCIPFNVFVYTYGVIMLRGGAKGGLNAKEIFCPPLIATILSLVIFMCKIQLPAVVVKFVSTLSNATMPMSMLVVGAALGSVNLLEAFKNYRFYIISFVRLIVMPLLTYFIFSLFTADPVLLGALVILAACPSGMLCSVLSIQYDRDAVFPSQCILVDTAISMLTIPIIIKILL